MNLKTLTDRAKISKGSFLHALATFINCGLYYFKYSEKTLHPTEHSLLIGARDEWCELC